MGRILIQYSCIRSVVSDGMTGSVEGLFENALGFDGGVCASANLVDCEDESGCVIRENRTPGVHCALSLSPSFPVRSFGSTCLEVSEK